jgi:Domain of unknown function (DUF4234)
MWGIMEPDSNPNPAEQTWGQPQMPPMPPMPQGAAQPGYAPGLQPMGGQVPFGLQMKPRSPIGVWLLPFITLGIYHLVYWYKIHAELAEFDRRRQISPVFELMSVWLLSWTIVLPIMSIVGLATKIRNAQTAAGLPPDCSGGIGFLLALCLGTDVIYYQSKLNDIIAANNVAPGQPVQLRA